MNNNDNGFNFDYLFGNTNGNSKSSKKKNGKKNQFDLSSLLGKTDDLLKKTDEFKNQTTDVVKSKILVASNIFKNNSKSVSWLILFILFFFIFML